MYKERLDKLWIAAGKKAREREYWLEKLAGELVKSSFPSTYEVEKKPGKAAHSAVGTVSFRFDDTSLSSGLIKMSTGSDIRLYILLAALLTLLLRKHTGHSDIIIAAPTLKPDAHSDKGKQLLNKVLLLRNQLTDHMTFKELLMQVRETVIEADKHQNYPLEVLLKQLNLSDPPFDVALVLENIHDQQCLSRVEPAIVFSFLRTDRAIEGRLEYRTSSHHQRTIERIGDHYRHLAESILDNGEIKVSEVELLLPEERKQLLVDFNHPEEEYPTDKTIPELFEKQVEKSPAGIAVVGTQANEQGRRLTYKELDDSADRLGYLLIERGVKAGSVVGIMVERSIDMIVGILGILKAGAAYLPINPRSPAERTRYMLTDSKTEILLVGAQDSVPLRPALDVNIISIPDALIDDRSGERRSPDIHTPAASQPPLSRGEQEISSLGGVPEGRGGSIAYIIYTSGSTGEPKGVPISHANFSPLMHWGYRHLGIGAADRVIQNLSYYFDWSVWEIFITLTSGAALYMITDEILLNPEAEVDFILENEITVLHITPTQYQYLVNVGKKLPTLKYLAIGAEKLTYDLVRRSLELVDEECRVFNMYGPTEATIMSAVLEIDRTAVAQYLQLSSVPIGETLANTTLLVLDNHLKMCPVGVAGELYIGGDALSVGYLNNPELTAERFITAPAFSPQPQPTTGTPNIPLFQHSTIPFAQRSEARLYRTGDRVRWLPDGTVEFLGRVDFQVKIRGFRIEPGEIENRLLTLPGVKDALVLSRQYGNGENYLCAYIVQNKEGTEALRQYLSQILPDYMVPSYFVMLDRMPLNPNGKVDLKALPVPEIGKSAVPYAAPRDETDKKLVKVWSEVLDLDTTPGIDDDFFELGGHSLKATALVSRIYKEFAVNIDIEDVFARPTIRELARLMEGLEESEYLEISQAKEKEYYVLSSAQERLFILQQFDMSSTAYNTPSVMELEGVVDRERFAATFRRLIARHEILRTSFRLLEGTPMQKVHPADEVEFEIEYFSMESRGEGPSPAHTPSRLRRATPLKRGIPEIPSPGWVPEGRGGLEPAADIIKNFVRPFDLSCAPLLRVGLIREAISDKKYILVMDMHHIISDGISTGIFVKEFAAIYKGEELPGLRLQYKDYAEWQREALKSETLKKQETYWLQEFEDEIPILDLPTDYLRPKVQSFAGSILISEIAGKEMQALNALASAEGVTLFMVLLAIYNIFLAKMSSQSVVVVGTSTAGRGHADLESIIGMFVNTLALKNEPAGEKVFREFLREVKENTLKAFANQDFQYEELVEKLPVNRDTGRNPLFDTMLVLQNLEVPEIEMPSLKLKTFTYHHGIAKFDLMLTCTEIGDKLNLVFEYCTRLFRKETTERFIGCFKRVVSAVAENPDEKISAIEIVSAEEKHRLLVDFNRTEAEYPRDRTIRQMFEEQAARIPHRVALVGLEPGAKTRSANNDHSAISYRELDERSDRLAQLLKREGIVADSVVGLLFEPCMEMMIGMMAILKAGGAYLPIDPTIPVGRIEYMLKDAAVPVLLTHKDAADNLAFAGKPIDLDRQSLLEDAPAGPACESKSNDLAYVIYTSGSTGRPKGVGVEHSQLVNYVHHMYNRYDRDIDYNDRCLSLTNIMFDVSVWEFFLPLTFGAQLLLLPEQKRFDVFALAETILHEKITLIYLPPGLLKPINEELKKGSSRLMLNKMLVGVEPIRDEVLEDYMRLNPQMRIINGYGPTETTICATSLNYSSHGPVGEIVPIGVPLDNNQVVLLDSGDHVVPVGIAGEICISGDGVSRGYINNPELTAEKYTPHPYFQAKRMYRTGDLAHLLPEGNIRFIGRRDHQLKVRGYRIELGEIETRLLKHKEIKQALVLANTTERTGKYLCAYIVSERQFETLELRKYLAKDLPDYMIPSYFVQLEKIPLTANGKVDRKALPEPDIGSGGAVYAAPRDSVEKRLAEIWAQVLQLADPPGIDHDFFELGGHSLRATTLVHQVYQELAVKVDIKDVFSYPTVREMAQLVKGLEESAYRAIVPLEEKEYYDLSFAQRRLWIISQFADESTAYNLPIAFVLSNRLSVDVFGRAVQAVADRHESLRTAFVTIDGEPKQKIIKNLRFHPDQEDLRQEEPAAQEEKARQIYIDFVNRPFNLGRGPMFRVKILRLADEKYLVFFNIHHIITDGWSQGILYSEVIDLYNSFLNNLKNPLQPLKLQYKDYTLWHNDLAAAGHFKQFEEYWLEKFKDKPNGIELPLDYPRKSRQTFNGNMISFKMKREIALKLREVSRQEDVTLFMSFLALFDLFLFRYTGQRDIIVGSPIAGRQHKDLHNIIGFLVNTLVYRTVVEPDESFRQLLARVKQETLESYEHQDYPFDLLVDSLDLERDLSQSPLFNVMLAHNNADIGGGASGMEGVNADIYAHSNDFNMSLFDLIFFVVESGEELDWMVMYNTDLFRHDTIERMIDNFNHLSGNALTQINHPISRLALVAESQYRTVVRDFNATDCSFPAVTLQELFEKQADQYGDKTAVVSLDHCGWKMDRGALHISYDLLNRRANRLAHYLREEHKVKANDVIGIALERSIDMVVALLGTIKSGAAYLAVDPSYPLNRILYMLEDSHTRLVIGDEATLRSFHDFTGQLIDMKRDGDTIALKPVENPFMVNRSQDILYVTYTSGSTGKPNGALVSHCTLTNLIQWQREKTTIDGSLRCLQFASINFDVSFQEITATLTAGGELHLIGEMERKDIDYLFDFLIRYRIEILYLPFYYLNFLFTESRRWFAGFHHSLKHLVTAGEQLILTPGLKFFLESNTGVQLHNHYGPAEMHVVTSYTLAGTPAGEKSLPPIGKPIANVRIYILDEYHQPVPVGAWGEIHIIGPAGFAGYLNKAELTVKKSLLQPGLCFNGHGLYRTGDIGRWLWGGNIELKGRKDSMVKFRGFRIELGEVESKILSIGQVRECVVVVREKEKGQKNLFAYVAVDNIDAAEIKRLISADLPQYMIPQIIVLDSLPLMPNGKVDRKRLPDPGFGADEGRLIAPPTNELEQNLLKIWSQLLTTEEDHIGIDDNFFELGGHSLKATTMMSKIHKELNMKVDLVDIFNNPTIRELALFIGAAQEPTLDIPKTETREYYPLSHNQQRMFILHQMQPGSPAYNMPGNIHMGHAVDEAAVAQALSRLITRHESLRTAFKTAADRPCQSLIEEWETPFEIVDISAMDPESRRQKAEEIYSQQAAAPFDLGKAPLFRAQLVKLEANNYRLMFNIHHIISDGWSLEILKDEFMRLYEEARGGQDAALTPLPLQYKDFAQWHNRQLTSQQGEQSSRFWKQRVADGVTILRLPVDEEVEEGDNAGAAYSCMITGSVKEQLKKWASTYQTTLFNIMFSGYTWLLHLLTGQEDIACSIITSGRNHPSLQQIIGFFVNSVIFRIEVDPNESFAGFIERVNRAALATFQHQTYPLELVLEELGMRYPDIPVSFNLLNFGQSDLFERPALFEPFHEEEVQDVKFDLEPYITEFSNGIEMRWVYKKNMFQPETIEYIVRRYIGLLEFFAENPGLSLNDQRAAGQVQKAAAGR